jgi:hypothetical protein
MNRVVFLLALMSVVCLCLPVSSVLAVESSLDSAVTSGSMTLSNGKVVNFCRQGGAATLSNAGDYMWWYGCSATSAGMIMGYYDRNGYQGASYPNLVKGGVAEATDGPLARAAIASTRHIADFYPGGFGASGDDVSGAPTGPWDCLADYMGTSQDGRGGSNGSTYYWYYTDGSPLYVKDAYNLGLSNSDGMYGMYSYVANYAGYYLGDPSTSTAAYTQLIYSSSAPNGFTWDDYKAEIDAGRPVIIQVEGHSMFGYGYNDVGQQIVLHDTWSYGAHTMTWGGSYSGMAQWGVVCFTIPEPSTLVLLGLGGLAGMIVAMRRRRGAVS